MSGDFAGSPCKPQSHCVLGASCTSSCSVMPLDGVSLTYCGLILSVALIFMCLTVAVEKKAGLVTHLLGTGVGFFKNSPVVHCYFTFLMNQGTSSTFSHSSCSSLPAAHVENIWLSCCWWLTAFLRNEFTA